MKKLLKQWLSLLVYVSALVVVALCGQWLTGGVN